MDRKRLKTDFFFFFFCACVLCLKFKMGVKCNCTVGRQKEKRIRNQNQNQSVSSTSRKTFFVKFEHQLQFPMSMALTVVHMYHRASQTWQTRGGRKTVTKANHRKHKTRTAKTLGVEPFSVGKTKENKTQAKVSLAADNRSPCRRSAVLYYCSESYTAHCHQSEK